MGHRQALVAYHPALIHKHVKFSRVHLGFSLDLDCECPEDFGKYLRRTGQCYGKAMIKSLVLGGIQRHLAVLAGLLLLSCSYSTAQVKLRRCIPCYYSYRLLISTSWHNVLYIPTIWSLISS